MTGGSLTIRRVQRHTLPDGRCPPPAETTEYIQADRKREEHRGYAGYRASRNGPDIYRPGPRTALIKRCDLLQAFHVNFDDREYVAWPIQPFTTAEEWRTHAVPAPESQAVPTVLVETETIDTGERRELFGRPARHVITKRRVLPLSGSRRRENETTTDGWYIDLDTSVSCDPQWWSSGAVHTFLTVHKHGDAPDVPTFRDIGQPERGYVLISRTTTGDSVFELEVTRLSTVEIDPSLFDVPPNFSRVDCIRQDPVPPLVIRAHQAYERLKRVFSSSRRPQASNTFDE